MPCRALRAKTIRPQSRQLLPQSSGRSDTGLRQATPDPSEILDDDEETEDMIGIFFLKQESSSGVGIIETRPVCDRT